MSVQEPAGDADPVLRVVIADDHAPTRAGVQHALEADGCLVLAALPDAPKAVAAALEHRPDVCLLDIHMPGGGIRAASEITKALPETSVVMLTASRDDEDLFEALRAGASGYLLKDMDPDRLAAALRGVMAGEAALPRTLALRVMRQLQSPSRRMFRPSKGSNAARLTSRETEVLELMADGLSTEQIADKLFIGKVTVRTHVSNVLKKLRVPDRESAVRLVRAQSE
jgi:DNA-binding NarL/FixJ family response regulator